MKNLFKIILVSFSIILLSSCSSDDDSSNSVTNATIFLKNSANNPVPNITVYVYDETTWSVMGDDPFFAEGQASSDSEGKAVFSNLEYPTVFNSLNNYQQNFRFSAHYQMNGVDKTKVISINFNKGDSKTGTIILD